MPDFTDQFNAPLTREGLARFAYDMATQAYPELRLADLYDYDVYGAWQALQNQAIEADSRGHLPDTFKKPNHMTFSNESKYSNQQDPFSPYLGGYWDIADNTYAKGLDSFYTDQEIQNYINRQEPNIRFINLSNPIEYNPYFQQLIKDYITRRQFWQQME